MAGVAEENLVAALEGGVFDGLCDFGEEAVSEVREQKGDDAPGSAGAFVGYENAATGLEFEEAFVYQWFKRFAERWPGGAEVQGHGAFGRQERAWGVGSGPEFFADERGELFAGHDDFIVFDCEKSYQQLTTGKSMRYTAGELQEVPR